MKLKIFATIMMISIGSTMSIAQTKKKATHKSGDESKTAVKSSQDAKHPNAAGNKKEDNPTSSEKQSAAAGNGLAPNEHGKVKGTGEGSGPGSDAGVGLNSGVGSSTASSSGSGAVQTEGTDGTNTKPRATLNMAGSPMPAHAGVIQKKKTDEKADDDKSSSSNGKAVKQKNVKDNKKRRG